MQGLQAFKNKALILNIHGGIFHFNQIWGIVSKSDRTHKRVFSCRVTFSRWTEKSITKVVLAPHFITYFMFVLSSSGGRNIHAWICMCVYVYMWKHIFVYGGVWLSWPCQKASGLAEACHEAKEIPKWPSGGPCRCRAPARRKSGLLWGPVGTARPRAAPITPFHGPGALGDTRELQGGQGHPDISVTSGILGTFFACLSSPDSSCTCSNGW